MYLYIGYLLVQIFTLINKLFESNLSSSITFFSVAVVFIWSAIPFAGYVLAKLFKAKGCMSKYFLLMIGISVGAIEIGLFYFDILSQKQHAIGTVIVFALFFITAFISTGNVEFTRQTENNELK